jgi:site-specific DNA-cytosine methylase
MKRIKDILEDNVGGEYDLNPKLLEGVKLKNESYPDYGEIEILGYVRNRQNQSRRIISTEGISPCLGAFTHGYAHGYIKDNERIRRFTPKEFFLLMGLNEYEIGIIQETKISETQQYKLAGNSIVVNVLEEMFKQLLVH